MKLLLLASTSPYRRALLQRLNLPFDVDSPVCDETPLPGESPAELVLRLARSKALSLSEAYPQALIIGSDQVADLEGQVLGKPGNAARAMQQLQRQSGRTVVFRTGICILEPHSGQCQLDAVNVTLSFRTLSDAEITRYIDADRPFDCAGSIRSESLALSLLRDMHCPDPTALVGLPLLRLAQMLRSHGVNVP